ncbi:MAG: isopentenyl-diphosphate Delta-isomerase [Candidatus Aenigmarchaeota archaeon]|nr:isopentenyl-diphosphate Delta-isomerase [Candidatus Aenigmarchaeota archaeon]
MERIILVDDNDDELGYEGKEQCHRGKGMLHRAFSVFIFDGDKMLITQRSGKKKTWPLYWSNACCSHPRKGEDTAAAAHRRLQEELGFSCSLRFLFKFQYNATYDSEWGEHEVDWVFIGTYGGHVKPDPQEIKDYQYVDVATLEKDVEKHPDSYTPWFKLILEKVLESRTG